MDPLVGLIESVQRTEYERAGFQLPSQTAEHVYGWVETLVGTAHRYEALASDGRIAADRMREYRDAYDEIPPASRHELIEYYVYLAVQLRHARNVCREALNVELDFDSFILGLVPKAGPNAMLLRARASNKTAILFNIGFIPLVAAMSRFIASAAEIVQLEDGQMGARFDLETMMKRIAEAPDDLLDLFDVMDAALFGSVRDLPLSFTRPPLPAGRIYQSFFSAMVHFAIGHELGHLFLGHLNADPSQLGDGALHLQHQQEFEADAVGLLYAQLAHEDLARSGGATDKDLRRFLSLLEAHQGAGMFFRLFALLERAAAVRLGLDREVSPLGARHPPIKARLAQISAWTLERAPDAGPLVSDSIDIAARITGVVELAYQAHLEAPDRAGLRPSALWRQSFDVD